MASLTSFQTQRTARPAAACTNKSVVQPTPVVLLPLASSRPSCPAASPRAAPFQPAHSVSRRSRALRAAKEAEVQEVSLGGSSSSNNSSSDAGADWIPVCLPEELPKGVRKEVDVNGVQVLLFWYRNQIYCIEARSPAEGAYSEGFIKAKFTQDYCIECPSTGSLFSLKDGAIMSWYPNNPVLAALTPKDTCRPLQMYPVKLAQEAVYVDINTSAFKATRAVERGGAGTSIDNNNVFTVQPTVYFEGMDPTKEQASLYLESTSKGTGAIDPAVAALTTGAVGIVAVVGTAICIYVESVELLVAFWTVLGGSAAYAAYQYVNKTQAPTK